MVTSKYQPQIWKCSLYRGPLELPDHRLYKMYAECMSKRYAVLSLYILASHDSSHYIQKCCTHPPTPLNCSDHLPISVLLRCCHALVDEPLPKKRVNWSKALKSRQLLYGYQMQVSSIVTPLIGNSYSCCEDLNKEITLVATPVLRGFFLSARVLPKRNIGTKTKPSLSLQ